MQKRYQLTILVTKVQREKLKKIAAYLRETRGTTGSSADAIRCLIDEVHAKITTPNYYKLKEKK